MTFPDLLDAALTGTLNRAPPRLPFVDESGSLERQFLRAASLVGLRWLAGRPPGPVDPVPAPSPAPAEVSPAVPRAASERLSDILERRPEALIEWLELVSSRGMRVPFLSLPDVLECARYRSASDRAHILEAGGARISWLAQFNADWAFAAHADLELHFNTGRSDDRAVALRRWRGRDPESARDALRDTWREQHAEERAALLEALEVGLSIADEEFLTHRLKDGRRDVRDIAVGLIRRVDGSQFGQRWSARAREVFQVADGRLIVHESVDSDPAWASDGLDARPPKGVGASAWLLRQVLALTPPWVWPVNMPAALDATDWPDVLRGGLADAVVAYGSAEWCARLLAARVDSEFALQLVSKLRGPWSEEFSRALLQQLPALIDNHYAVGSAVLRVGAWRLHPSVLPLAESWLETHVESERLWLRPALERLVATLDYRLAMRRELDP